MWAATSPFPIPPPPASAIYTTPHNNSSVKTFGHTILSAAKSTNPKQRTPNQKSEGEAAAAQISGSDVLWALQKAAAAKEKNRTRQLNPNKKERPSADAENSEMNRRVRPLRIGSDWGSRLGELEKRLREISETV